MNDQYDDKNLVVLRKLSTIFELPDFVKEASVVDEKELNSLPRTAFGDPVNRKYPITSRKDTYLSALYFRKHASEYEDKEYASQVKENIDKALDLWDIPHTLKKKASVIHKEASAVEHVRVRDGVGNTIDDWELRSPRDFEKAAIQLFENKNMFSFEQRKDIARQLIDSDLRKTAELSDEVDTYLDRAAGFGMCTKLQLIDTIRDRARLYKEADERFMKVLTEYAESLEDEELDCSHLNKTAALLDFMDKQTGISRKYRDLTSPEECLFVYTEKTASELKDSYIKLQSGKLIKKAELDNEALDEFFDKYLGDIPKVSYEEKLDILESLPLPDAEDFERFYLGK